MHSTLAQVVLRRHFFMQRHVLLSYKTYFTKLDINLQVKWTCRDHLTLRHATDLKVRSARQRKMQGWRDSELKIVWRTCSKRSLSLKLRLSWQRSNLKLSGRPVMKRLVTWEMSYMHSESKHQIQMIYIEKRKKNLKRGCKIYRDRSYRWNLSLKRREHFSIRKLSFSKNRFRKKQTEKEAIYQTSILRGLSLLERWEPCVKNMSWSWKLSKVI